MGTSRNDYLRKRDNKRSNQKNAKHRVKLRQQVGIIERKQSLKLGFLNVDGLSASTFEDVRYVLDQKSLDLCILVETKRRSEEIGSDIAIHGYNVKEIRRSDAAGDKGGGGMAYYTKQSDGILFREHSPPIADPSHHYVRNERFWVTVDSLLMKTAVCGLYLGCQYPDDRHGEWNNGLLQVINAESAALRAKGYRVVMLGDFNAHTGSEPGVGVPGNHADINPNGNRFLRFLQDGSFSHINGNQNLTTGLWTRQRGNSKSVLDYAVVSSEHLSTVKSLAIDERGLLGGGSDHNFLILTLNDLLVKNKLVSLTRPTKKTWNCLDNVDWEPFSNNVETYLNSRSPHNLSVDDLSRIVSTSLLTAGEQCIGLKDSSRYKPSLKLPKSLVDELKLKRELERTWKSKSNTAHSSPEDIAASESAFLNQKSRFNDLLFAHKNRNRARIKELCAGKTTKARKNFWSIISTKSKQSSEISAVVNPVTGALKCSVDEVNVEIEEHLCRVFSGSLDPNVPVPEPLNVHQNQHLDNLVDPIPDHDYRSSHGSKLPLGDSSENILSDPAGWTNREFSFNEVESVVKSLKGGKSSGWDTIPNEFLMHAPKILVQWLTILFNKVKSTGTMPKGWNKGRVTLIHKSGLREVLLNYRPITVIISLSGLFSKLLNTRLSEVVESHKLLGEIQNGFRKERQMADNNFILDSILMKAKFLKQNVHLCYVDISKAYDSVNREILWEKLERKGFNGDFLNCLKALYDGDCLVSSVNGITTKPVYPTRGLRQGCSLSPLLFALYISDLGSDITESSEGFTLGGLTFSGLLFADDIVLISRSFEGLERLVSMVQRHCEKLKLEINTKKSNIVTPDDVDQLLLVNSDNEVVLSLSKVLSYKYLGTETTLLMSSTGSKRQKKCLETAKRYKFACFYVARTGPDIVDTVLATWSNIAIPSMISGCEVIPFSDTTIEAIERLQSQLAKHVLGLPQSAPNICAQTELGLKPFRMILYQHQLNFYTRVMNLPRSRWVHRVLSEHLQGDWTSPYIAYIAKIRQQLQLLTIPATKSLLKIHLNSWFIDRTNLALSQLSHTYVAPISSFSRARYVSEHEGCSTLASLLFNCAGLGNKAPRPGRQRTGTCSLCQSPLNELHVAFLCPGMEDFRSHHTEIMAFLNQCRNRRIQTNIAYKCYLTGHDWDEKTVPTTEYLKRGSTLQRVLSEWFRRT